MRAHRLKHLTRVEWTEGASEPLEQQKTRATRLLRRFLHRFPLVSLKMAIWCEFPEEDVFVCKSTFAHWPHIEWEEDEFAGAEERMFGKPKAKASKTKPKPPSPHASDDEDEPVPQQKPCKEETSDSDAAEERTKRRFGF